MCCEEVPEVQPTNRNGKIEPAFYFAILANLEVQVKLFNIKNIAQRRLYRRAALMHPFRAKRIIRLARV